MKHNHKFIISGISLVLLLFNAGLGLAADWPPTLDTNNATIRSHDGRAIERYTHGPREAWGYPPSTNGEWGYPAAQETGSPQQNHNSFYVVTPINPRKHAPLCVVLHSAGRTAYDYLGFACLERKIDNSDDPATAMTNPPDDVYALYLSSMNGEWWGWTHARQSPNFAKHINAPSPAELRVLDTIEWVVTHYKIDRNRIYLCGVSMGGCGALGVGMPHGDVFAAVRVTVPAGTEYAAYRMGGFVPAPAMDAAQIERDAWRERSANAGLPAPPVVVDFSSQADSWSTTQPALLQAAQIGHLPLVLGWGMFGHAVFASLIGKYPLCQVALAYPWMEIRKNEAYPVFTHASSDQRAPWLNAPTEFDESGQLNAWFRWKKQRDAPSSFAIQLWIAHPTVKNPPPTMPEYATTDITLRRLQRFKVQPGGTYTWQVSRHGQPTVSGKIMPDAENLLTIPGVTLTTTPAKLTLKLN